MRLDTMFGTTTNLVANLMEFMSYDYDNEDQVVIYTGIYVSDLNREFPCGETGNVSPELAWGG